MAYRVPNPSGRNDADALHNRTRELTQSASHKLLEAENKALVESLRDQSKPIEEQKRIIRRLLENTGTDVALNELDPYGDGDQTPIVGEPQAQVHREMWNIGGDVASHLYDPRYMSDFIMHCIQGKTQTVESILKKSSVEERRKLMEKRETGFRMSAILFVIAISKHPLILELATGRRMADMDFIGVSKVLLKYGARPDVRDVSGKTVAHYGVGSMATKVTLQIADYCIQAAKSCTHFGATVELHGLSNETYNGQIGTLGGYVADKDRRVVYLEKDGETKELAISPKNILYENSPILDETINLVDVIDRLESVALHEVIMSNRTDVAAILLDKYDASLDVKSAMGVTPRTMACVRMGGLHGSVVEMVRKHAIRTRPKAHELRECMKCKAKETEGGPELSRCKSCRDAYYCSRACQVSDWPRHKANCKEKAVKLAKPARNSREAKEVRVLFNAEGTVAGGGYKKPRDVAIGKKFWIKIQAAGENSPLLIYDQSRDFTLDLQPGTSGFSELRAKVLAEPTSMGRKCHVKALFDENGDCFAYPYTATLKEW
jgi:hypothetical protein